MPNTMQYTTLGRTGLRVSQLCFGTWAFGGEWGTQDLTNNKAAIREAFNQGINCFDTAQAYGFGAAEDVLQEVLRPEIQSRRGELVLVTKGGLRQTSDRLVRDSSRDWLRLGVTESLRHLGTDYIDVYFIHWPDPNIPMETVAHTLDELVREGKIRFVGGSNFTLEQMQAFARVRPLDVVQPPYHLFRRDIERAILPYCQAQDIGVMVYGPLAHGLMSGGLNQQSTFPENDWRSKSDIFEGDRFKQNLMKTDQLKAFAAARNLTLPQLAVAWVLANPAVDEAIVGAVAPHEIRETALAADVRLSPADLQAIDRMMIDAFAVGGPSPEGTFTTIA